MRDRLLDQLLTPDLGYADADTGYDNAPQRAPSA